MPFESPSEMRGQSPGANGRGQRQPAAQATVPDPVQDQTLSEALRTGDCKTIEAIVSKLAGQLETLKTEALRLEQGDGAGRALRRDEEQFRRRLSSLPEFQPVAVGGSGGGGGGIGSSAAARGDRRKRMTMAFGTGGPEPPAPVLMCAYCGTGLGERADVAAKGVLSSDVGYCCHNCESILSDSAAPAPGRGDAGGSSSPTTTATTASDGESDYGGQVLCEECHEPLGDEYVNVLGRRFHVMHFVCEDCNIPLYALGGYLQDPSNELKFFCQRDYLQRFSPACHACSVQITSGEMVVALGRTYHSECFVCSICQSPFAGDVCYEHNGQPLCEWHWYTQNGLLCTECGGIISAQCVVTRGRKYHQACAEAKYGERAVTIDEARRQIKAAKAAATAS
ncbi:Transforming growth factor beta-1-induced transcript 1 protein [Coemansia javaensis]|uniref:Transforming growth factor beta-1-induced transcript 1 protein n=1 Tax=Coemansia javaensis TaxID=2761396 RepID=A0A9W8LM73_9FUNG|nr:Transforming growth factor beta-1-induced transcript 1 protein [Coemansia javaensis]